ncbi:hypothetical protein WQ54_04935 [Bacillus sp. SA1-12]|nr:hypothetical protein WQ54_04935 [Bacillus sp. SA1-12]
MRPAQANDAVNKIVVRPAQVKEIVDPVQNIVKTIIRPQVVRHIHPTNILNIDREAIRIEHFFPVNEEFLNERVVEELNCGDDMEYPQCKPLNKNKKKKKYY